MSDFVLSHGGLFAAAFLAATVFPFQSELVLVGLLVAEPTHWPTLLLVASVGNTLGSAVNWVLGRLIERYHDRAWFPVKARDYERVERWYARWGVWSLLFAWLPFGGDALTVVAGAMRTPLLPFLVLVAIGKTARYAVLVAATVGWFVG
ncbi:YqaA family protein [uncultured Reyranella sp.]|uniref:YqaA family protein n=1 Tax=uncultured Reyranella sp. TaxID=735512 RepID=UPI0025E6CA2C|nr:YqaA family protein [uncultured Reyranella sp.]